MKVMKIRAIKGILHPTYFGLLAVAGITIVIMSTMSASAAIRCNGQFQVIRGQGELSTPYCEDKYLAIIARSYGWKVSNVTIRQNPNLKARVCRHVGHDSRLRVICSNYIYGNDGGTFRR